jgi:hypothetical protein
VGAQAANEAPASTPKRDAYHFYPTILREVALHREQFRSALPRNDRNRVRNFGREPNSMFRRLHGPSTAIRSAAKRLVGPRVATIPKRWHAVCVDAKPLSCAEAHAIRKRRFLSKEAPALPLEGCSNRSGCPCTYKHHEDRRGTPRRKGAASFTSTQKVPVRERRESIGRRRDD